MKILAIVLLMGLLLALFVCGGAYYDHSRQCSIDPYIQHVYGWDCK